MSEDSTAPELRRLGERLDAQDARIEALIEDAAEAKRKAREAAPVAICSLLAPDPAHPEALRASRE